MLTKSVSFQLMRSVIVIFAVTLISSVFQFTSSLAMEGTSKRVRDALEEVDGKGRFMRTESQFRNIISPEHLVYKPEANRYHLYISYACPWANRCMTVLKMKGLSECIGVSVVHPTWQRTRARDPADLHTGWSFAAEALASSTGMSKIEVEGCTGDPINSAKFIRDLYEMSGDTHKKFSVPVLWDKKTKSIVNNESSEILRMLTKVFDNFAVGRYAKLDLYPEALQHAIDEVNDWVYPGINDGVYRCGFAKTQEAYDEAIVSLYRSLDRLENLLSQHRYLVGDVITEADIRLFQTLVRFDEVYVVYFKCNVKRIKDYTNIHNYCREIYQMEGIKESINMAHIKAHYYTSHPLLNHYAIIPKGPDAISEFLLSHDRERF